jgi:class 3 adenylate cyclase
LDSCHTVGGVFKLLTSFLLSSFFSDIIGFTDISSNLDPRKIANLLDRLYHKFDELSTKLDLYKVETIGDAYMAVTNLVKDQPNDHCKRIAEFAIEAVAAANDTLIDTDDSSKGYVNIRVGFHVSPVVADVVGNRNPRYCLFGDAVNTAARMESNSGINRINCSEKAAILLKEQCPELPLKSRGELSIKGKGMMKCFWVNEQGRPANAALERVKAKQKLKLLRQNYESWRDTSTKSEPLPEQPQRPESSRSRMPFSNNSGTLSMLEEVSEALTVNNSGEELSIVDETSGEFLDLEGNLKDRLSRHGKAGMNFL